MYSIRYFKNLNDAQLKVNYVKEARTKSTKIEVALDYRQDRGLSYVIPEAGLQSF